MVNRKCAVKAQTYYFKDEPSFQVSEQEIIGSSLFYTHFCIFFLLSNTYNDTSLSLYIANAPLFIPPQ